MDYDHGHICIYGEAWNNLNRLLENLDYLDKCKIQQLSPTYFFRLIVVYHTVSRNQLWTVDECIETLKKRINELHQQNLFTVICDMNQINEPSPLTRFASNDLYDKNVFGIVQDFLIYKV